MRRNSALSDECTAALGGVAAQLDDLVAKRPRDLNVYDSMLDLAQALSASSGGSACGSVRSVPVAAVVIEGYSAGSVSCPTGKVAWNGLAVCIALVYKMAEEEQKEGAQLLIPDLTKVQVLGDPRTGTQVRPSTYSSAFALWLYDFQLSCSGAASALSIQHCPLPLEWA